MYERVGVIFFSLVFVMLGNQQNIPRIFLDRLLFYREKGAGVYGAVEYWWSIGFAQVLVGCLFRAKGVAGRMRFWTELDRTEPPLLYRWKMWHISGASNPPNFIIFR